MFFNGQMLILNQLKKTSLPKINNGVTKTEAKAKTIN